MNGFEGLGIGELWERNAMEAPPKQPLLKDRLFTIQEAAEFLRLSTRTVREYVKRGEIRGKLIGKRWRFKRADLDAFFENAPSNWYFAGKNSDGD
jgi:excisionase family DNA binding protein